VAQAAPALDGFEGDLVVLYGDTPFISAETLERMAEARQTADVVVLGFEAPAAARYGRLKMAGDRLERIIEWADATPEDRRITFCNSGIKMASARRMLELVAGLSDDNARGEFYLTDIVALANAKGLTCTAIACDISETLGINSRIELAAAETAFQNRARAAAQADGVTLAAPETVIFAQDTAIGRDAVVEPYVVFGPGVTVDSGARIRAFSNLEGAHVCAGAVVGPYARLRPGAELDDDAHAGSFVEIKNARIGEGAKVNHLSYIGDASVGAGTNIGAGTITCNYDGVNKHQTDIGADTFIGSNSALIAPVTIGDGAMVAAGSTITRDVEADALGVARGRQENKSGYAAKIRARNQAIKKAKGK
jgi:bifunctional UDP-N-acetylglucosamine pyrophosphorylase/glucosamine-1-phosphate N-acetyltransferase